MFIRPSGGDDTALIQSALDAGGLVEIGVEGDVFHISNPIGYVSNSYVRIPSTIVCENTTSAGWPIVPGMLLCSKAYLTVPRLRSKNVTIDMRGGRIVSPSKLTPLNVPGGISGGQHGIGITMVDGFRLIDPCVVGRENRNLFCCNIRQSNNGHVTGGHLSHRTKYQGGDGFHLVGNCHNVLVEGLSVSSGDDSSSQTLENALNEVDHVIQDVTYRNCLLRNFQHSSVKLIILSNVGPNSSIKNIKYENCDMITQPGRAGAGAPVRMESESDPQIVDNIQIIGGRIRVEAFNTNAQQGVMEPHIFANRIRRFSLIDTEIEFYGRQLMYAARSPDLVFRPSSVKMHRDWTVFPPTNGFLPLVQLYQCPRAQVDTSKLFPVYPGQPLVFSS